MSENTAGNDAWDFAKKRAEEGGGGNFISLKNDKDKVVGVFVGPPHVRDLYYDKDAKTYEEYGPTHAAKGLPKSARFSINVWVRDDKATKIWDFNAATMQDVIVAREKYGFDTYAFEIQRHGKAGDTKTTYSILPETKLPLSAEEKAAIAGAKLHDLTASTRGGGSGPATDMESHDKKVNGTNGKATAPSAVSVSPTVAAEMIDPETKAALVARLKQHEKGKVDAFLSHFKVRKMGELKKSDIPAATAMLDSFDPKPVAAAIVEEDPFA